MRLKGKMFNFDGNDGSGKHTQAEMLRSTLLRMRKKVLLLSFPRYEDTFFGRELRKALRGDYGNFVELDPHLASQLYAADRWASKQTILQALQAGVFVICDRYASANQIHQGGKINNVRKRRDFLAWLEQLEYGEYKIPRPDISIYLDVPATVSRALMSDRTRDTVENNPRYLENSHRSAQWLMKESPGKWAHIKCTQRGLMRTREEIHDEVFSRLRDLSML